MNEAAELGDILRALAWGPDDEARLRASVPRLSPRVDAWVEAFYVRLTSDPTAVAVLGDEGRIMRLRRSLSAWFHEMLTLPVDDAYARAREEIGRTHVRIGMPQHLIDIAVKDRFGLSFYNVSQLDLATIASVDDNVLSATTCRPRETTNTLPRDAP